MRKTETSAAVVKAAYIRPNIVCIAVEYSLCAVSPFGGGAGTALPDPEGELLEEEEEEEP
ncbi:hypothetical protein [Hoylesella timonensis]|uniref:hypothetical protein n=1 Tax=Hoylesella timonensis TaxID=386414 RepID=UPI003369F51B